MTEYGIPKPSSSPVRNSPESVSELGNLFEINQDNTKIRQMNKDVEDYERAVQEKAALDEQARKAIEA